MIKPTVPSYKTKVLADPHPGCSPFHKGDSKPNQHTHPHQIFFNELMREFDPNDPNNKNRTFEKMVAAANRKHLNPGEQSFHYYVDADNKVHGFVAIGNINDTLPHIIISDTGDDISYYKAIEEIKDIVENVNIDELMKMFKEFQEIIEETSSNKYWYEI